MVLLALSLFFLHSIVLHRIASQGMQACAGVMLGVTDYLDFFIRAAVGPFCGSSIMFMSRHAIHVMSRHDIHGKKR
jgi:hypothetical protein